MLTRRQVEELSAFRSDRFPVVSFYLNIDKPGVSEERYAVRLKNLMNRAEALRREMMAEQAESLGHDLDRIRVFVREQAMQGARGIAVFACSGAGLWKTFVFPNRVGVHIEVGSSPYVKPLFRMLERYQPICTTLIGKGRTRIFLLYGDEIEERSDLFSVVPKRHDQGGWAQARLQRHHDERVAQHLKHTADALLQLYQEGNFTRLLIGGTEELVSQFRSYLHPYLKDRVVTTFPMRITASPKTVQERTLKAVRALEEESHRQMLERLASEVAAHNRAVAGIVPTLRALERGQIATLFVNDGYSRSGYRCTSCGHLLLEAQDACGYCSGELEKLDDIVAYVIDRAYDQEAEVVFPVGQANQDRLASLGHIAAELRYQIQP